MLLPCPRALAILTPEKIGLQNRAPAEMRWDEHGGTFVLRVGELAVLETAVPGGEPGIRLAVDLSGGGTAAAMSEMASQHRLALPPPSPPPVELTETPILTAVHVPGANLFIYSEDAILRVRAVAPRTLELSLTGEFRSRRVPCQEADIVIHLDAAAMARLLAYGAAALQM